MSSRFVYTKKEVELKMEFKDVVYGRRSIRVYENKQVPVELVKEILEYGVMAPSGTNIQPWYFVAIHSPEKRAELGAITNKIFPRFKNFLEKRFENNPEVVVETGNFLNTLGGAPVVILAFLLKPDYSDKEAMYQSVSAAMQNMSLTAYEKGLGSCWLTSANMAGLGGELQAAFAPEHGEYLAMLTLGYPKITPRAPKRKEGRYDII